LPSKKKKEKKKHSNLTRSESRSKYSYSKRGFGILNPRLDILVYEDEPSQRKTIPGISPRSTTDLRAAGIDACHEAEEKFHGVSGMQGS
jgi:hypothetical protein